MQNKYHSVRIEEEHHELFIKHQPLIRQTYKLGDEELQLLGVEAKLGEYDGVYYRMTFSDASHKRYTLKIEMPKPQQTL